MDPLDLSQLTEALISLTAPGQSRPSIKCFASAASRPTFPRYKLHREKNVVSIYSNGPYFWKAIAKRHSLRYKGFETRVKLWDFNSVVLYLNFNTPPFLNHNNPGRIIFTNHIRIERLNQYITQRKRWTLYKFRWGKNTTKKVSLHHLFFYIIFVLVVNDVKYFCIIEIMIESKMMMQIIDITFINNCCNNIEHLH